MKSLLIRNFAACSLAAPLLLAAAPALAASPPAPTVDALRQNFVNPPIDARPMVRWWWFGPAVVKPEIRRELQQMKADGLQGAELAFVYPIVLDDPTRGLKNLPFLSPEMLDDVTYAQAEGRKLGLRIDVTLCSGWPYGGPHITLEEAATHLRTAEVSVPAGATTVAVPTLAAGKSVTDLGQTRFTLDGLPKLAVGDSILSAVIVAAATPPAATAPRRRAGPRPVAWDAASAQPLQISGAQIAIAPSDHPRTAVFFIQSHTGQQVKRAAVGADGYVLDPYSHEAIAKHLEQVGEPLLKAFGATPPYAIFSDSLEAFGGDWTPRLPEEFKKRRGYDLIPHLAELVAGGTPAAATIRHDYGRTLTELVNENYLQPLADWAAAHGTKFRSQTYHESAVSFSSQNIPQLAEGEGPQWRTFSTLRWATSSNHVFGHVVSSGETFTWLHSPVFRATPLDMKAEADLDFIMGENLIICHGWPYSPPAGEVPEPGWSLYAAGVFNDHNPWHPVMPAVTSYIGRLSYLMRQGMPANQVAVLLPTDDAWARFQPMQTSVSTDMFDLIPPGLMSAILSAGYNADFIDADAIGQVGLGTHQILVLPPTDRIPLQTLRQIAAFVAAGGKTISVGRAPSIDPEGKTSPELTGRSEELFSSAKSSFVPDNAALAAALHQAAKPDLQLPADDPVAQSQLGFIRRRLPEADIYFVTNTGNQTVATTASFATDHPYGQAWDPDSTAAGPAAAESSPLRLTPYESRVFVFASSAPAPAAAPAARTEAVDLSSAWKVTFPGIHKSVDEPTLADWISDPSTLHYSGEAVYSRDVTLADTAAHSICLEVSGGKPLPGAPNAPTERGQLPETLGPDGLPNPLITRTGPGMHAYYDPPIREAALVTINGQPAGALWHPPYRLDVTKFLRPGVNHVEIHVFNTALNAWSARPPRDYGPLIAKYGDRFQMQ
ncbi:MAG TPA: glycosyl hydrolase, partial [Opitutaceae bacterium]|nr:glycosyl hydrolase [Opitutaceae bacterium]